MVELRDIVVEIVPDSDNSHILYNTNHSMFVILYLFAYDRKRRERRMPFDAGPLCTHVAENRKALLMPNSEYINLSVFLSHAGMSILFCFVTSNMGHKIASMIFEIVIASMLVIFLANRYVCTSTCMFIAFSPSFSAIDSSISNAISYDLYLSSHLA